VFGINDEQETQSFWSLSVDFEHGEIRLGNEKEEALKTVGYTFEDDTNYKITLVNNNGVARVYVNDSSSASLVLGLPLYKAGEIADNLNESHLKASNATTTNLNTSSGDYYVGGYSVQKVVNLTDNNYRLSENEYTLSEGVLSINDGYLKTLETNTQYTFRAVTSLTDLDFLIQTEGVGAQVYSLVEKYYRGDDIKFELNRTTTVNKAFIDNEEYKFTQSNELVTINKDELLTLGSGEHTIKLFTTDGRPEAKFSFYEVVETLPEVKEPSSHVFFFIDIAIFATLIFGYLGFALIKNRRK